MKVTSDRDRYDALQAALVAKIANSVRGHVRLLIEGRVPADLSEITKDIVFSVTSILDGADEEGAEMDLPMVTFATSEARNELIVADPGEGSWMHEMPMVSSGPNKRVQPTLGNPRAADAWR